MIRYIPQAPPLLEPIKQHPLRFNLLVALISLLFSGIGFQLAEIEGNISPIWPSSGFAVTAIFYGGYRLLPGILAGAFAANSGNDITLISAFVIALGSCGEATIAGWLLRRIRSIASQLVEYTTPIWILITSLLAPTVAAIIGSLSILYLNSYETAPTFGRSALTWYAGDAIGILIIAPVLLSLKKPSVSPQWFAKLVTLCALTALVYTLIYYQQPGSALYFLAFMLLIPACQWFGAAGCALSTLCFVVFSILTIFTHQDATPFKPSNNELLALDTFLIALSVTSLTVAALYKKEHFKIPATLLAIGWLTSGLIYHLLQNAATKVDEKNFTNLVQDTESAIKERLNNYVDALIAGAAIYSNSDELRTDEWHSFIEQLNLQKRYPGINGIGIVQPLDGTELNDFVAHKQADGRPDFAIKKLSQREAPSGDVVTGDENYIITYIEPYDALSKLIGLNIASESSRLNACRRSRDTGEPSMTESIALVQDGSARPSVLVFYPIYRNGAPQGTISERRDALTGWINASFMIEAFLENVLGNRENQIQFKIYDKPALDTNHLIYSSNAQDSDEEPVAVELTSTLQLADQNFSFTWSRGTSFQKQETASATIAAASLSLGGCLLVVIVVNLQSANRRTKQIVKERTLALSAANIKLQQEIRERQKAESKANKAYQAADAANSAKSEFLATMSHEMRTPMNSVLGFSELLGKSQLDADQQLWASYIQTSGNSLLNLINDILDFSKIEAGKFDLESTPFSIREALEEVVRGFSLTAGQKGLLIDIEVSETLPEQVLGDPTRVKQVLINLVSNALKFTPKGRIIVTASWHGTPQDGLAKISVADTGIGIPEDKMDQLFQRFSQVDSSTTRQYGGTGLGLAICKRIISLMKGQIQIDRSDKQGTTISFQIPFIVADKSLEKVIVIQADSSESGTTTANQRHVLVVDDNAVNRKLAATVLRRMGHAVETANNGIEAIERVKEDYYDIVFLDCQMPILDGYDATRRIRQLEAEGQIPGSQTEQSLPIIALTANASEKDRETCLKCGMNDYICKPAKIDDYKNAFKRLAASSRESGR